jgi:hypothetical protein
MYVSILGLCNSLTTRPYHAVWNDGLCPTRTSTIIIHCQMNLVNGKFVVAEMTASLSTDLIAATILRFSCGQRRFQSLDTSVSGTAVDVALWSPITPPLTCPTIPFHLHLLDDLADAAPRPRPPSSITAEVVTHTQAYDSPQASQRHSTA